MPIGTNWQKIVWDDFYLNPVELLNAVLTEIPEWKETIEIPDGIFRKNIPFYDEIVIRELIANALVHRVYTMRGDIFINLYPNRLEVHSPGLLPWGVTPNNIISQSVRRNEHLAKVFYDLRLMEREGSGYDKIYEVLLSEGKQIPVVEEKSDRVKVTVFSPIFNKEAIRLIEKANNDFPLKIKGSHLAVQHSWMNFLNCRLFPPEAVYQFARRALLPIMLFKPPLAALAERRCQAKTSFPL